MRKGIIILLSALLLCSCGTAQSVPEPVEEPVEESSEEVLIEEPEAPAFDKDRAYEIMSDLIYSEDDFDGSRIYLHGGFPL